jgi:hypothetical protein
MFCTFLGPRHNLFLITTAGAVLVLAATGMLVHHVLHLLKRRSPAEAHLVGAVLLGYGLLFSVNASLGRIYLGAQAGAQSSRYMTLLIPVFLAMYFYLLSEPWIRRRGLVLATFIALLVPAVVHRPGGVEWLSGIKRTWASCYVQTENIHDCDRAAKLPNYPNPEATHLQAKLDYLKEHRFNLFADPPRR